MWTQTHLADGILQDVTKRSIPQVVCDQVPRPYIWVGPRPAKALVLECRDGTEEGDTSSVLGFTPQYSRLLYMSLGLL